MGYPYVVPLESVSEMLHAWILSCEKYTNKNRVQKQVSHALFGSQIITQPVWSWALPVDQCTMAINEAIKI